MNMRPQSGYVPHEKSTRASSGLKNDSYPGPATYNVKDCQFRSGPLYTFASSRKDNKYQMI